MREYEDTLLNPDVAAERGYVGIAALSSTTVVTPSMFGTTRRLLTGKRRYKGRATGKESLGHS
ncbi:hypothetical protein SALBM217S_01956 [Streptomyces griseoloalbus]